MFSLLPVLLSVILGKCNYIYGSGIMYMLGTHGGDAGCFVAGVLVGMGGVVWVCPWLFFCSCLVQEDAREFLECSDGALLVAHDWLVVAYHFYCFDEVSGYGDCFLVWCNIWYASVLQ